MDVKNLVHKAVDQINEGAQRRTETTVREIVNKVLHAENDIAHLQKQIIEYKKELQELEYPAPVSLEL